MIDDLPNLEELHVPLSQAMPITPPQSYWEQRKTYAFAFDVDGTAILAETDLKHKILYVSICLKDVGTYNNV